MTATPTSPAAPRRRTALFLALLTLVTLLAYLPALRAGFVWDDDYHLTENPNMTGVAGLRRVWSTAESQYYPLTSTTFWVQRQLWGLTPWPYHLVNVLLLVANSALLALVLRRLNVPGATVAAFLFALHPVHVESTAWVTELKDLQSGVFYLLAAATFLAATADPARLDRRRYFVSLFLFVLAVLSKTTTVMLPPVLLLCLWWRDGRVPVRRAALTFPFFAISALAGLYTIWAQSVHGGAAGPEFSEGLLTRAVIAARIILFYLGKLLWPHPLVFIYPRWSVDASTVSAWIPVAVVLFAATTLILFRRHRRVRPFTFAFACFVTSLFPVLWIFAPTYFVRYSYVGDHFQYLAGMSILSLIAALLVQLPRPGRIGTLAVVLSILVVLTFRQSRVYASSETLWQHTLAHNPAAWMAHHNYARLLHDRGETELAERHFLETLRLKPDHVQARLRLAAIAASRKQPDVAERWFREAIANLPKYKAGTVNYHETAVPHALFAQFLADQGRHEEAVVQYETALAITPGYPAAVTNLANLHRRLGMSLYQSGQVVESLPHFRRAVEVNPTSPEAHNNLGIALVASGQRDAAVRAYQAALSLDPSFQPAKRNLELLLNAPPP